MIESTLIRMVQQCPLRSYRGLSGEQNWICPDIVYMLQAANTGMCLGSRGRFGRIDHPQDTRIFSVNE